MPYRHVLITGGAGFIGSNFARYLFERYEYKITVLDSLTYAGNLDNLSDLFKQKDFGFVNADICDAEQAERLMNQGVDAVVHFAAESHVDHSIARPMDFTRTNVFGTQVLLEAARRVGISRFVQISTDEVYGALGAVGRFTECSPLNPSSPYSASKAAADLLVLAYHRTYALPAVIIRCSNNYGPYQFPEKLIPVLVDRAITDQTLPIYGNGLNVRDWLHVQDNCVAIDLVLQRGQLGEVYNVGGNGERTNLDVARMVLATLGKPESLITFVPDRPGHDHRYAIDPAKISTELGWRPLRLFEDELPKTVRWYVSNSEWLERIRSGDYRASTVALDIREVSRL